MISPRPKWWQWPTMLSLDAPAVALAWQALLYRSAGLAAGRAPVFVLGSSVWLSYVADRWFEGWRLHPADIRTQRHSLHQRRRWEFAGAGVLVLAADIATAAHGLGRRQFLFGGALLLPVAVYLLSHQLVHRHSRWRVPKEVCIALLLTLGVGIFPAAAGARRIALFWPLGLFALLAFANCALISVWENAVDRVHGQTSLAGQFAIGAALGRWAAGIAALLGAAGFFAAHGPAAAAGAAAAASGILLLGVDRAEGRLGWEAARILADLALLTPFVVLACRS